MRLIKAHRCRALLVVLLLGFTALTFHASIHAQPDQQGCVLCGGHFKPSHGLVPVTPAPILHAGVEHFVAFVPKHWHSRPFTAYRQRAPPVLS